MENKKTVVIIGDVLFPHGDAGATRIFSMAKALRDTGYDVTVISRGKVRPEDKQEDGRYIIDGIAYFQYTNIPTKSFQDRMRRPVNAIDRVIQEKNSVAAVLLYASATYLFAPEIIRYCKKNAIKIVADVVEWYEPSQYRFGLLDWHYLLFSFSFRVYFPQIRQMIVISRLLDRYFQSRGCKTERIPALLDCAGIPYHDHVKGDKLRLLYAGMPGRKDRLGEIIKGMLLLSDAELQRIEFNLLGPDDRQLASFIGNFDPSRLQGIVHAHGRVSMQEVSTWLLKTDFTVLLRKDSRVANAGFPSKVPESLAHGVPVLANMTSDMAVYLHDGQECLNVKACSPEDVAETLRRALLLPQEALANMRRSARKCAEDHFDYRVYAETIDIIVSGAK